jgi:tetratricopeptide (TPR) repeat protein
VKSSRRCLGLLLVAIGGLTAATADPGHEINIEALTAQLAKTPDIPELYYQRAVNYRETGQLEEARSDFGKALSLDPAFLPAGRELARLDDEAGHRADGIARLRLLLANPPSAAAFHLPGCWSALADLLLRHGDNEEALAAASKGISLSETLSIDLLLFRAEAQRRLGRHAERVDDLAAAAAELKSIVLRIAWIEALIDAGRTTDALPEIDREIASSRFTASWRIRRARALMAASRKAEAFGELDLALAEIETRLRPERPDLSLLCEKALIHALRDNLTEAEAGLALARERGADAWMTRVLESALAGRRKTAVPGGKAPPP